MDTGAGASGNEDEKKGSRKKAKKVPKIKGLKLHKVAGAAQGAKEKEGGGGKGGSCGGGGGGVGGGSDNLSVGETNALRAKLGLAPLK